MPTPSPKRSGPWRYLLWRILIDAAYLVLLPGIFLAYLILSRGFTRPKLTRGLQQKLGAVPRRDGAGRCFWVHAVSVGEVQTSLPLISGLEDAFPGWEINLSVSTPTGYDVATKRLSEERVFYAPIDFGPIVSRVLRRRRPDVLLLVELELWPGLLIGAKLRGVPVFVANGRLTERSCRRYLRVGPLARWLFSLVDAYGVQTAEYEERFRRLGVAPDALAILGNLKHDHADGSRAAAGRTIRERLYAPEELVVVAGSTHPGEELILCRLYEEWKREFPRVRLVLAPRHVERVDAAELARWSAGTEFVRWSRLGGEPGGGRAESLGGAIVVVDTLGELERFYYLADVIFVGGTLIPHGGHNLFEAARLGKPVVFGPHFENFREEGDLLLASRAAIRVEGESDLGRSVHGLLGDSEKRRQLGARAKDAILALRGATGRHVAWLRDQMRLFFGPQG